MSYYRWISIIAVYFCSVFVDAAILDFNAFYLTDTLKESATTKDNKTIYSGFVGFGLDKKKSFNVGWSYSSFTTIYKDSTTKKTYKSTQMGPGFVWFLDKDAHWRLGFSYNLSTDATYQLTGSTKEEWSGTSSNADFGYQIAVSESFMLGMRLNYSVTTIKSKLIDNTQTNVTYRKTLIYPSIGMTLVY